MTTTPTELRQIATLLRLRSPRPLTPETVEYIADTLAALAADLETLEAQQ